MYKIIVVTFPLLCACKTQGSQCAEDAKQKVNTASYNVTFEAHISELRSNLHDWLKSCLSKGECIKNTESSNEEDIFKLLCLNGKVYSNEARWCHMDAVYQDVSFMALNGVPVTQASVERMDSGCFPASCTEDDIHAVFTCSEFPVDPKYNISKDVEHVGLFKCLHKVSCTGGWSILAIILIVLACLLGVLAIGGVTFCMYKNQQNNSASTISICVNESGSEDDDHDRSDLSDG